MESFITLSANQLQIVMNPTDTNLADTVHYLKIILSDTHQYSEYTIKINIIITLPSFLRDGPVD